MADRNVFDDAVEIERYELSEAPRYRFDVSRRSFVKLMGAGVAVILVARSIAAQESGSAGTGGKVDDDLVAAWLHIGEDGNVTACTGKVEVGQNIRTSLAQAVADELRLPLDAVTMIMGDTDLVPYDRGTFGSQSTPRMAPQLRRAAAAAREMLVDLAAEKLDVDRGTLTVSGGRIGSGSRTFTYADLAKGRDLQRTISDDEPVTSPAEWTVAGKSLPKVDGRAFVTGAHRYASDIVRPGMRVGKILRPPSYDAEAVSVDDAAARARPDITVVHDGNFIGVVAPTESAAEAARDALVVEWRERADHVSRSAVFDHLRATKSRTRSYSDTGSVEEALSGAAHVHAKTYHIDYIAHTPLEPRAAVAEWVDGKLTVWTGTQRPFGVRSELSRAFDIPEDRVRVHMPDTGSGYGGKHTGEAAIEAARLSKASGTPVRVVWTREEEFTWAYLRPGGVIDIRSGVDANGRLVAWQYENYNSGGSGIRNTYDVANESIVFHRSDSPLRQGSYRALASAANIFARETHVDDLAHHAGEDPLAYRLRHISDDRMAAVFTAAADRFGWSERKKSPGRGFGIGGGTEKGGYIACCAEVEVNRGTGKVRVVRVAAAFECGAVVNPVHCRNQVEGGLVQGIGGALFERIDFRNGQIRNASLTRYRVPRFSDMPEMDVVLVDRPDLPSAGAGETPLCGIAPAIGNAIFDATGVRLTSLPLAPNGLR